MSENQQDVIESLRQQLEIERMRNVACDVVAMADTPTSAEEARKMLPDYRSAALESVIRRVGECIALRQQLADKQAIIDDWLYANGPNGWIESLRQQLADREAQYEKLLNISALRETEQQEKLEASQKREVMLREFVKLLRDYIPASAVGNMTVQQALAATADMKE